MGLRRTPCRQAMHLDRRCRSAARRKQDHELGLAGASTRRDCPRHRRAREFWWLVHRAIGRSLAGRFFSRAGAVLMSAHDGRIDHHVFVVVIACQQLENALENAALRPSTEALVHDLPVAETRRQVTPGDSRSIPVKNSFDEQPVVRCITADMAFTAGQKILDPLPLVVSQSKALHGSALRMYRTRFFGHKFELSGLLHAGLLPDGAGLARTA